MREMPHKQWKSGPVQILLYNTEPMYYFLNDWWCYTQECVDRSSGFKHAHLRNLKHLPPIFEFQKFDAYKLFVLIEM